MKLIHPGENGEPLATLSFESDCGKKYFIQQHCSDENRDRIPAAVWLGLIERSIIEARQAGASEMSFRVTETSLSTPITETLPDLGFTRGTDRVEYRKLLSELPLDEDSPLQWQALEPSGPWSLREAANLLWKASEGDPQSDSRIDPYEELASDLRDPVLSSGPTASTSGSSRIGLRRS